MPGPRAPKDEAALDGAQRDELLRLVVQRVRGDGLTTTAIPFLSLLRSSRPTAMRPGLLEPSLCVVLQGERRTRFGREIRSCGAGAYVMSALEYPTSGQIIRASAARPYLAIRVVFDVGEIAEVIVEGAPAMGLARGVPAIPAVFVGVAGPRLIGCLLRALQLLDEPDGGAYLANAVRREIVYRLLRTEGGPLICRSVTPVNPGIGRVIDWLRRHVDQPLDIAALAKASRMSVSSLHHEFKAATALAPLQFQKQLRLQEARRLLVAGEVDAGTAAFRVGYESPSQFSREYRRMFGAPPRRDIRALAGHPAEL
ncbi:MAG: AraC family transcriptional regulator [Kofleriaceae bacterium]